MHSQNVSLTKTRRADLNKNHNKNVNSMCTITVSYDGNNTFAAKIIDMMRESGVFTFSDEMSEDMEKEAFLHTSRVNASKIFSKYL